MKETEAEKKKLNKESFKEAAKMLPFLKPYARYFWWGMLFLIVSVSASMAIPFALGQMIDSISGNNQDFVLDNRNAIMIGLFGVLAIQAAFSFFRVIAFANFSQKSMAHIRGKVFENLLTLRIPFFEERRVGELTSRLTTDVSQLEEVLSFTMAIFIRQIATILVGIPIIIWMSPKLTLFMLAIVPVLVIGAGFFGRFIRKLSRQTQDEIAATNVIVEEGLQSIQVVKAFTNEKFELKRYVKSINAVVDIALKAATYRGTFVTFLIFCLFGAILMVIWYGLGMIDAGAENFSIGNLVSFIIYTGFIGGAVGGMGDNFGKLQRALGASDRIRAILEEEGEFDMQQDLPSSERVKGRIEFDHVKFAYPTRKDITVLEDINITVAPGEKIALAGHSGAGKSTVIQLLMRFYDPEQGAIRIDGKELKDFPVIELRKQIGIVPQEVILFGGTIKENIAYGRPHASEEEIKAAATKANALQFIQLFPEGLDTVVGERGIKLSGGQRQRIAIARAILKDPAILILDEATSSLDLESERLVQDALNKLMENRTTIIIAHRLTTIREVDCIYVISEGKISESGTHDELAKVNGGIYQNLLKHQFEAAQTL